MDPILNPFSPGAGARPPELAGRDVVRETVRVAIERIRRGYPAKSVLMVGLRGVGKTVLLERLRADAVASGIEAMSVEAPESRSLPAMIAPQLRQVLLRLSRREAAKDLATRALRGLVGFARSLKVKYSDIEVAFDVEAEPGLADNGDLEHDLQALFEVAGEAAKGAETAIIMFIDELQYVNEEELAFLIGALHKCAQRALPIALVGAGLPQLRGKMGSAKSYAERLFDFPMIGPLSPTAASDAIVKPIHAAGAEIEPEAVRRIIDLTKGYPYFIQEWGKHSWEVARVSPITSDDVESATEIVVAALDESFFRVRFERLSPLEKRYLRAMAELGEGPHRSGDIADMLKRTSQSLGPTRSQLIDKGMIWSPNHGDTAFTVPLFDQFMRRIIPGEALRAGRDHVN